MDGDYAWHQVKDLAGYDLTAWTAVEPGHEYRFTLSGSDDFRCEAAVEHHPVDDTYEPNDTPETAARAASGLSAYFHVPLTGEYPYSSDYDDWYRVSTDGKPLTLSLTGVPADATAGLTVYDPEDTEWSLDWESARYAGSDVEVDIDPEGRRTLLVQVQAWGVDAYGTDDLPDSLSQPYTLTLVSP